MASVDHSDINHAGITGITDPTTVKLDDLATPDDNTDLNSSTSRHGLLRKLDNDSTHFLRGDGSWAVPSGGIPGTSFAGYNTVGGSFKNMNGAYAKKITLAATSIVMNIGLHVKGNATNAFGLGVAVMTSGGTVPANVIARNSGGYEVTNADTIKNGVMNTTARWIEIPVNAYLVAGDYWIVVIGGHNTTAVQLAHDGSGTDATVANYYPMDHSVANFTAGTDNHSIRALILA